MTEHNHEHDHDCGQHELNEAAQAHLAKAAAAWEAHKPNLPTDDDARAELTGIVALARREGASWKKIGEVFGTTRDETREYFGCMPKGNKKGRCKRKATGKGGGCGCGGGHGHGGGRGKGHGGGGCGCGGKGHGHGGGHGHGHGGGGCGCGGRGRGRRQAIQIEEREN